MLVVEPRAWDAMVAHALAAYPKECCGVMLGSNDGNERRVRSALPLDNVYSGAQEDRYEIRPEDLHRADRLALAEGMEVVGIFHSHPDHDAYFSETDLKNSCPWYSFVVLSVRNGQIQDAASFQPDADQTGAPREELRVLTSAD